MLEYMHILGDVIPVARATVDYSGHNRTRTVMVRANNGVSEFVQKTGSLTADAREENTKVFPADVSFDEALAYAAERGHTQGILFVRKMFEVETPRFTYSLRDVVSLENKRSSTLFELEASKAYIAEVGPHEALEQADETLLAHDLVPLDGVGWMTWVARIHEEVDRPFSYTPAAAVALTASLDANNFFTTPQL